MLPANVKDSEMAAGKSAVLSGAADVLVVDYDRNVRDLICAALAGKGYAAGRVNKKAFQKKIPGCSGRGSLSARAASGDPEHHFAVRFFAYAVS